MPIVQTLLAFMAILYVLLEDVNAEENKSKNDTLQSFLGKLAEAWNKYGGLNGPEVKKVVGTAYREAYNQDRYLQNGYAAGQGSYGINEENLYGPEFYNKAHGTDRPYQNVNGNNRYEEGNYGYLQGSYGHLNYGYEQNKGVYEQGIVSGGQNQIYNYYGYGQRPYGHHGGLIKRPYGQQSGYDYGPYPGSRPSVYRPGSVIPALPPGYRPPQTMGFMAALDSITRNDDLRCVPRLLCELAAAGKVDRDQRQTSFIPFAAKDSLIKILTVVGLVEENAGAGPALVLGRAALLGYTTRGDSRPCLTAYPTCPTDPDKLVHYLNNHNGGFFAYFGGHPQPEYPVRGYRTSMVIKSGKAELQERIQTRPEGTESFLYEDDNGSFVFGSRPSGNITPMIFSPNHVSGPGELQFSPHRGTKTLKFPRESKSPVSGYDRLPSHLKIFSNSYQEGVNLSENQHLFRRGRQVRFPEEKVMVFPSFRNNEIIDP